MAKIITIDVASDFVDKFRSLSYVEMDTARAYSVGRRGTCEKLLGSKQLEIGAWANVNNVAHSFMPGSHRSKEIVTSTA
jgi:hypothetical protein